MSADVTLEQQLQANDPDVRLMLQVRDDVQGAFETVVERYQDRLLGILTHLVGHPGEAEDLAQEVFLRVYRNRKAYKAKAKFSTWLFTIAHNLASNHLRGKARHPRASLDNGSSAQTAANSLAGSEGTPSAQMRQAELSDVVKAALDQLGDDQRMAVLLNKFEEMTYSEIADVMGRSEPAIKSLLARARTNLREQLEPYLISGLKNAK